MQRKLFMLGVIVLATVVSSFTAPRKAEAFCNKSCCGINVCTCCNLSCQCPSPTARRY
jgi:hypothetical protein